MSRHAAERHGRGSGGEREKYDEKRPHRQQKQVLHHLISNKTHLLKLLTRNPLLAEISNRTDQKNRIETNRNAIVRSYNMARYRQTLLDLYTRVVKTPVKQQINKKKLLAEFFNLKRFSLLKWGDDEPQ